MNYINAVFKQCAPCFLAIVLVGISVRAQAQTQLQIDAFTAGGTTSSSSNITLKGSVGQVFTGTASGSNVNVSAGFWPAVYLKGKITAISPDDPQQTIPDKFSLDPAYPNPFNPTTTIRYALPQASNVRLTVYNMLGRQIKVLVNQQQKAGMHEVTFHSNQLSSGTYIYRIEAGDFIKVRKMTLLK